MTVMRYWLLTSVYIKTSAVDTKGSKVVLVSPQPVTNPDTGCDILKKEETKRREERRNKEARSGKNFWAQECVASDTCGLSGLREILNLCWAQFSHL